MLPHPRRALPVLGLLAALLGVWLVLHAGCGGGGGGGGDGDTDGSEGPFELATQHATLTLDVEGRVAGLRLHASGRNVASPALGAFLELLHDGKVVAPTSLRLDEGTLAFSFGTASARARVAVASRSDHLVFRVTAVEPADAEGLRLRLPLVRLGSVDPALNGTYDDDDIVSLRSTTASTRCDFQANGGSPILAVEWTRTHGIVGGGAALLATPRTAFADAVAALERAEDLPSPHFNGVPARASAVARESYLFLTYYQPGDLPALLEYAEVGEFGLILVLRGLWRESAGTYGIAPGTFPGGLPDFTDFCTEIRDAGLGVGVHVYGPSVSPNDPLVTPVPADGLLAWACPPLAADLSAAATSVALAGAPELPAPAAGGFPGTYLRLGDEIVRYAGTSAGPPFAVTGCERGALGTTASAHAGGDPVQHLAVVHGLFLVDPDGPLRETLAHNLGQVVNAAGIDMVYFDGAPSAEAGDHFESWYYLNRMLPAYDAAFDHSALVQTSRGPGRQLDWHLVPRSASADGHGDIKYYLDLRTPAIETIRRGFTVPDVGWYGFDPGRPPDYLEYIAARCLGWGCPLSVQTHRIAMEKDARARETMEIIGRYERCKRSASIPQSVRDAFLVPGEDFRLLEAAPDAWHVFEAAYDPDRDVRTLTAGTYTWSVNNPEAESRALGVEIVRGAAIQADADWSAPGTAYLETFHDVAPYVPSTENDAARLVDRVGKVSTPWGAAREGVEHELAIEQDARVGGPCTALTASNTGNVIGWCATGRVFDPLLDLSSMSALGLWVYGEKSGVTITLELWDDQDNRAIVRVPVFFDGWRLHTIPLATPAGFDRTRVKDLVLIVSDLPPGLDVELRFVALRATPTVRPEADLTGVVFQVGGRSVSLPVPLPPGGTARIDALGRLTIWPGGMAEGQTWPLVEGPITVDPGLHTVRFEVAGPDPFPGDVSIRLSRLRQIHPD